MYSGESNGHNAQIWLLFRCMRSSLFVGVGFKILSFGPNIFVGMIHLLWILQTQESKGLIFTPQIYY